MESGKLIEITSPLTTRPDDLEAAQSSLDQLAKTLFDWKDGLAQQSEGDETVMLLQEFRETAETRQDQVVENYDRTRT